MPRSRNPNVGLPSRTTLYTSITSTRKEEIVKRTDGVKSGQGCKGVTVGALRAVAPAALYCRQLGSSGFQLLPRRDVSCALLSRLTSAKHRSRAYSIRNGDICSRPAGRLVPRAQGASGTTSVRRLHIPTLPHRARIAA
eukprot:5646068-Prymnesium_polylepis.1